MCKKKFNKLYKELENIKTFNGVVVYKFKNKKLWGCRASFINKEPIVSSGNTPLESFQNLVSFINKKFTFEKY